MRTRITPNTGTFYAVYSVLFFQISTLLNVPFSSLTEAAVRIMFFKTGVFKNFAILTGNCVGVSFLIKLQAQDCNFIKKRLQLRCFLVNIPKYLRIAFFIKHLRWMLLYSISFHFTHLKYIFRFPQRDSCY